MTGKYLAFDTHRLGGGGGGGGGEFVRKSDIDNEPQPKFFLKLNKYRKAGVNHIMDEVYSTLCEYEPEHDDDGDDDDNNDNQNSNSVITLITELTTE